MGSERYPHKHCRDCGKMIILIANMSYGDPDFDYYMNCGWAIVCSDPYAYSLYVYCGRDSCFFSTED